MKVENLQDVINLRLSEIESLDPITVKIENYEPGKGKINIECYGEAWSSYWGGMSGRSIQEFFLSCDNGYIIENLCQGLYSRVTADGADLQKFLKDKVIEARKEDSITGDVARDLFDKFDHIELGTLDYYHREVSKVLGDDWHYCLPEVKNPKYVYLDRIVSAVKQGLKEHFKL